MTQSTALALLKTGSNIFVTGEPGSGKTYVINKYVRYLRDHGISVAVTASTGIAATHISGVTIHSWSGVGIRKTLNEHELDAITTMERLVKQITGTDVLIIDEISMLEAGMLDMVELICRTIRRTPEPFGGLQVVLVGDFFQLPPISKYGEPPAQFAFSAAAWTESMFDVCYLTEQHRQSDAALSSVLASIRNGTVEAETVTHLHSRRVTQHPTHADITKLYSHNTNVDEVNAGKLKQLAGKSHTFSMTTYGPKSKVEALIRGCLSPEELQLKQGAAVMCTRNNPEKGFVNGTLATVVDFDDGEGYPIITTRTGRTMTVEPMEWAIEDGEKITASITQIPLRLAWAMTVHKSQGMSLDAAVMDLSHSFAYGQGYVALSRVRTLAGLFLLGWNERALLVDPIIQEQDRMMREQSAQVEKNWLARSTEDHAQQQQDFLRHTGGKVPAEKKTFTKGEVTEVPPHAKRLAEIRKTYPQAYTPWTEQMDEHLKKLFTEEKTMTEMSKILERHSGGVRSRLKKLGLVT